MNKSKNIKLLKIVAGVLLMSAGVGNIAFADTEGTSVTYATPYLGEVDSNGKVINYSLDTGNDVTLDVNVAEINALEITLSTSNLVIDLAPKVNAASFGNDTLNILVGTSNSTGYTLTMQPLYNDESTTSLTRTESINNTTPTIDTISSTVSPDIFSSISDTDTMNKWGYLLSTTNLDIDKTIYNPVLTTNTINSSTEAISNDLSTIVFAAKADSELPAGNYRTTLKFMAVANPTVIYIQNLDSNLCVTDEPTTVTDVRDNEEYQIQRLADGRCWMLENLRLDGGRKLTPEDSNVASDWNMPANIMSGDTSFTTPQIISTYSDNTDKYGNMYGNLYNYCAASAGTICSESNSNNVLFDICPVGWRLPTGGSNGEFAELVKAYNLVSSEEGSNFLQSVLRFPLAGLYNNHFAHRPNGDYGYYWSSTAYSEKYSYDLEIYISSFRVARPDGRISYSVRCTLK